VTRHDILDAALVPSSLPSFRLLATPTTTTSCTLSHVTAWSPLALLATLHPLHPTRTHSHTPAPRLPFFLNPAAPQAGVNKVQMYNDKFGPARVAQMVPAMTVRRGVAPTAAAAEPHGWQWYLVHVP
jgi:hypothetical protein